MQLVLNQGLKAESGRATFTTNPLFTLKYGTHRFENNIKNVGETIIYMIGDDGNIKPALESDIRLDHDKKEISGWPNRYRVMAYGYFFEGNKGIVPAELMIGAVIFNNKLYELLGGIESKIKSGLLQLSDTDKAKKRLLEILNDKEILVFRIMVDLEVMAQAMIDGLINQTLQSQIRKTELSIYSNAEWKIKNNGDHPVPVFENDEEIQQSLTNIRNIIKNNSVWAEVTCDLHRVKKIQL